MDSVCGAPNEAALLALMERTGYHMLQENGQRKYGPPPDWTGPPPPRGCEIFVGKIPRDCYEDELVPAFERCGKIYEFRLMMDFSGSNRGYCFVTYTRREDARRAVTEMNNYEIRRGRFLGVCMSVDNCRLFVGGIPKHKQQEEILEEMKKVTEGVVDVIVYPSASDKTKNRGFAFVEYASHRAAAMARRKLIPGRIQLWGHQIAVDWAEPEQEVDDDIMSKVKILYVRNLMLSTPEETLEAIFNQAAGREGAVERVKKLRDYAFVHFYDRDDAIRALSVINGRLNPWISAVLERHGSNIDGSSVEVVLAKPVDKNSYMRYTRNTGKPSSPSSYGYPSSLEQLQYLSLTSNGNCPASGSAGSSQGSSSIDEFNSRSFPSSSSLMMMPRIPLRGRCYSPAPVAPANEGIGRGSDFGAPGTGFPRNIFRKTGESERLYDIVPGMELTPTFPGQLNRQQCKASVQILEELCLKNRWGYPSYELNSTFGCDGSGDVQLFAFKIRISGLGCVFMPAKLSPSIEKAQNIAAEHTLQELGVAIEGGDASIAAASLMMLCGPGMNTEHLNRSLPLTGTTSLTDLHSAALTFTTNTPSTQTTQAMTFFPMTNGKPTLPSQASIGGSASVTTFSPLPASAFQY